MYSMGGRRSNVHKRLLTHAGRIMALPG
jgi:transposase